MTNLEIQQTLANFKELWPASRRTQAEWSVFIERAARIQIDGEQAKAALRNLKATSDDYPTIAVLLRVLHQAEGPATRRDEAYQPQAPTAHQWNHGTDESGMTSFERRVRDDPKFRVYARKAGRLSAERLDEIRAKARAASPVPFA